MENDPVRMTDKYPYTTLNYANGPGYVNAFDENGERLDLSGTDTNDLDFLHPALIPMGSGVHSGHDVGLWATGNGINLTQPWLWLIFSSRDFFAGPMSYFFHSTHEQSYVGHVMAYALCSGPYNQTCRRHLSRLKNIDMRSTDVNHSSSLQMSALLTTFGQFVLLVLDRNRVIR